MMEVMGPGIRLYREKRRGLPYFRQMTPSTPHRTVYWKQI